MGVAAALVYADLFSTISDNLVLFALLIAGALTVCVMVTWGLLRAIGDIYEEWCNLRRRCAEAKKRLRQEIGAD